MSLSTKTRAVPTPTAHASLEVWPARAQRLLDFDIDFIPNGEFRLPEDGDESFAAGTLQELAGPSRVPADLPAHLRRLCESELLTARQESDLFRAMNFAKYCAHTLRAELDVAEPDPELIERIEALLDRSQLIRDRILQANMRLVMSIVKKFVTPQQSFDEMLSDGIYTLMQTVEKFDFDRGFRFSTYAYRSIARNAYRVVMSVRKDELRFSQDAEEWADVEADGSSSSMSEQVWMNLREMMSRFLDRLDRRERFVIRSRYALGSHRRVRTCQDLANKLGVSKERVRQLEQRAVSKMRTMAADSKFDELLGAATM